MPSILLKWFGKRSKWYWVCCRMLLVYFLVCLWLAYGFLHPRRFRHLVRPVDLDQVMVQSSKGPVPTWATPNLAAGKGSSVVFVMAHGYGGDRSYWTSQMLDLAKLGFDCVAPSMPGQDASPDDTVGFGPKEATMVVDAVRWARSKCPKPPKIVLWGVSMGGSAVWLATQMEPSVDAVVSEGAYTRFDEAIDCKLNEHTPGGSVWLRPMVWLASWEANLDPSSIVPLNAAAKWKKPALIVQAENDSLIPMRHAKQLATASNGVLWVVPYATHAQCFSIDEKEYLKRILALAKRL